MVATTMTVRIRVVALVLARRLAALQHGRMLHGTRSRQLGLSPLHIVPLIVRVHQLHGRANRRFAMARKAARSTTLVVRSGFVATMSRSLAPVFAM